MDETRVRFVKLIVEDKMNSNVIYVSEEQVAQIGEFLDLPGGYRYKVLDNTHDGSLVVALETRKGLGWFIVRFLRTMMMLDNRPLKSGSLLLVEENHEDPVLQQYYAYMKQSMGLSQGQIGSYDLGEQMLPPIIRPLDTKPKNTIYTKRLIMAWAVRTGWAVMFGAMAIMYFQMRSRAAMERQQAEAKAEEERRIAETFKRQQELDAYKRNMAEAISSGSHDPTAELMEQGLDLQAKSSFDQAEALLREALRMRREVMGDEHIKVVESMEALANLLEHKAEYEEAEKLRLAALEIRRKLSGEEDRTLAMTVRSLAGTQQANLNYEEAQAHYEDALRLSRQFLKDEPIELARTIEGLSGLMADMGNLDRAEELAREALALREGSSKEGSLERAEGLEHMGRILRAKREYGKAEGYLGEALVIRAGVQGENSPQVVGSMLDYASTLFQSGETELAGEVYKEAIAAQRKHLEQSSPGATVDLAPDIATYMKQLEEKRASDLARREQILAERKNSQPPTEAPDMAQATPTPATP